MNQVDTKREIITNVYIEKVQRENIQMPKQPSPVKRNTIPVQKRNEIPKK